MELVEARPIRIFRKCFEGCVNCKFTLRFIQNKVLFTNDQNFKIQIRTEFQSLTRRRSLDILSLTLGFSYLNISRWILSPIWKTSIRWTIARSRWESQERESRGTTRYVIIWSYRTSNVFSTKYYVFTIQYSPTVADGKAFVLVFCIL